MSPTPPPKIPDIERWLDAFSLAQQEEARAIYDLEGYSAESSGG